MSEKLAELLEAKEKEVERCKERRDSLKQSFVEAEAKLEAASAELNHLRQAAG